MPGVFFPFFPVETQEDRVRTVPVERTIRRKEATPVFKQEKGVVGKICFETNLIIFYKTATQICNIS
jgi:hypothetical protein